MAQQDLHKPFGEGASQVQRLQPALLPENAPIDARSLEDLLAYIHELSETIRFFDEQNFHDPATGDNWQPFFRDISTAEGRKQIVETWGKKGDHKPHLALILAFLKLFQNAQGDLNQLTRRHLDFYYRDVLRFAPRPARPDKVHVLFELAKHVREYRLDTGTLLNAGKDETGKPIRYATDREVVLNQAKVTSIKSIYVDKDKDGRIRKISAAPVADSADGLGAGFGEAGPRWQPFGESQRRKSRTARTMTDAEIGLAIASPMFFLKEGNRTVTLTFDMPQTETGGGEEEPASQYLGGLSAFLSGEEDWIAISGVSTILTKEGKLEIQFTIPEDAPAVAAFNPEVLGGNFATQWPVLKLIVSNYSYAYEYLRHLRVKNVTIHINVWGIKDVIVQNDQGLMDASKPFYPFGTQPAPGSNFYIGSAEIFRKRLDAFTILIQWKDVPAENLGGYYVTYLSGLQNSSFTADVHLLRKGRWDVVLIPDAPLFGENAKDDKELSTDIGQPRSLDLEPVDSYGQNSRSGFIRLQLKGPDSAIFSAFGHKIYPTLFAQAAIDPANHPVPNPPYTPEIQQLTLDYESTETAYFGSTNRIEQFFYIEPFGHREVPTEGTIHLLPRYEAEGHIFIGLQGMEPPQSLNLLFQVIEGAYDQEAAVLPEEIAIRWSYLSRDQWKEFFPYVNTTEGFQQPGIIAFNVPEDATGDNSSLPAGLHWLRGTVEANTGAVSQLAGLHAQGVAVALSGKKTGTGRGPALPAGTISQLAVGQAAVRKVSQPYPSFGGRPEEEWKAFATRVSERLRHKRRAVNAWDYERLVLEAFPAILKVKCLSHTGIMKMDDETYQTGYNQAGNLMLVIVPDIDVTKQPGILEPRASARTLAEIQRYVRPYTSPFATVKAVNPVYEHCIVHCRVGFQPGLDEGYYREKLEEEIIRFISPWAYEEGKEIIFGGKICRSDVLEFVESRAYVEVVYDLKVYHMEYSQPRLGIGKMGIDHDFPVPEQFTVGEIPPFIGPEPEGMMINKTFVVGYDDEIVRALKPESILVSNPFHYIDIMRKSEMECI